MVYVLSDIHGNKDRLQSVFKQVELKTTDTLYVLGDCIDRHPFGVEILIKFMNTPNVKLLLGNHEYMMLQALDPFFSRGENFSKEALELWFYNGGEVTYNGLLKLSDDTLYALFAYLRTLPVNINTTVNGKKFLLVHSKPRFEFDKNKFYNGFGYYPDERMFSVWQRMLPEDAGVENKTVIFGHTPTNNYQTKYPLEIWVDKTNGKIGIDCGCGFPVDDGGTYGGRLACLRLDDMRVFYSE